ncbi:MAG: rRNA maturation RNase YbeY [Gemmatimonadales bacterium]
MAASRRAGSRPRPAAPGSERRLARAARQVLAWEGARGKHVRVDLTLLPGRAMRRLSRRATGRHGLTDVIAFALPQPDGRVVGDVYICPDAARQSVGSGRRAAGTVQDEMIRLVVHGTLHVLGYDHPEGPGRTRCAMWRRQERYVHRLANRAR